MSDLRSFFIRPEGIVVYSLDDPDRGDTVYIYNAGSLELAKDPEIEGFSEIDGLVTSKFGVKPMVVCYDNGDFEIVYAMPNNVLRSDGTPARPDRARVTATSVIIVPDLSSENLGNHRLTAVPLNEPDKNAIDNYITESRRPATVPIVPSANRPSKTIEVRPPQTEAAPTPGPRSPSPRMTKVPTPRKPVESPIVIPTVEGVSNAQVSQLRQDIDELKSIVQAMNRRNYKIYPVDLPQNIPINGKPAPVVSVDEIMKRMGEGQIERFELNPMLQAYAGSHRSNNRLLTFHAKNGDVYHVRADYDPKTNKINQPK